MSSSLHAAAYKPLMQLISRCSQSDNWKVRRCVFTVMSHMAEGCRKQMETDLKLHTNNLLSGFNDRMWNAILPLVRVFMQSHLFIATPCVHNM